VFIYTYSTSSNYERVAWRADEYALPGRDTQTMISTRFRKEHNGQSLRGGCWTLRSNRRKSRRSIIRHANGYMCGLKGRTYIMCEIMCNMIKCIGHWLTGQTSYVLFMQLLTQVRKRWIGSCYWKGSVSSKVGGRYVNVGSQTHRKVRSICWPKASELLPQAHLPMLGWIYIP
jgi:hypothetical protein